MIMLSAGQEMLENRAESIAGRAPAVPVALFVAAGIVVDRFLGLSWMGWLAAGCTAVVVWGCLCLRQRDRWAAVVLLLACLCLGGARHHLFWSIAERNAISQFATETRRPVHIVGTLAGPARIRDRQADPLLAAWPRYDHSTCRLDCRQLVTPKQTIRISGQARLMVTGHLLHAEVGDRVAVRGMLYRPSPPENPGQFDYRRYLRRQGVRCVIHASYPEAVERLKTEPAWRFRRAIARLRNHAEFLLVRYVDQSVLPVARAVLLGQRTGIDSQLRTVFARSGTMHLLAISGLHMGVLALYLWLACRLFRLSPKNTSLMVIGVLVAYALLTGGRPSVVRAVILIAVLAAGDPWHRQPKPANSLAVAAMVLLMANPSDLFDAGAQLSFLAVAGILWSRQSRPRFLRWSTIKAQESLNGRPTLTRGVHRLLDVYWTLLAIWIFTTPLVAARFNLLAPVGLLVNVVLVPFLGVVLAAGFALLLCGLLLPMAVSPFAAAFNLGLLALTGLVEAASRLQLGHLYIPDIPLWWIGGYYLLLGGILVFVHRRVLHGWGWRLLGLWLIAGLSLSLLPGRTGNLRCTFLSVGHGCAVLLEMPGGKTLLYDAGALHDGRYARDVVQGALWQAGYSRLDAVVVSHADLDHFNAVPGLLRTVPVGTLILSRPSLDFRQELIVRLCNSAAANDVPIRLARWGDRLQLDPDVGISVLHPGRNPSEQDNRNSLVLLVEYCGRRILLTGDLEDETLETPAPGGGNPVDVLLAPHHGSPSASRTVLKQWADPQWVVISSNRSDAVGRLRPLYNQTTEIVGTEESGAVTAEISPTGALQVSTKVHH